ncbi:MAG TPA: hypothetical protein VE971_01340 [Candidatus Eisenbacteria bacterium]|nr:hypothetical protein [Candidatus Eisenbacteria bacterium]
MYKNQKLFVTSDLIKDNQTWNTCPKCLKDWQDFHATPGLLHRTRICDECLRKGVNQNAIPSRPRG